MSGADGKGGGSGDGQDGQVEDEGGAEIIAWPGREARGAAERPTDPAEALIVKTLASVTGRDPADLLREIRSAQAETPPDDASKVVDLGAVREARRREEEAAASAGAGLWGPVLKSGVQALFEGFARHTPPSGELVIDAKFMKTHGLQLLGEVLASVGGTLLGGAASKPRDAEGPPATPEAAPAVNVDATAATGDEAPPEPAETPEPPPERRVDVQMDLGSLAAALFSGLAGGWGKPRPPSPPPAPEPTPEPPAQGPDDPPRKG